MASTLCQNGSKNHGFFGQKLKFGVVWHIYFCSNFTSMWYKHFQRNVWRDLRLPMSAFATAVWKRFDGKFTVKMDFPITYSSETELRLFSSIL